jgi:peptidoglycan/LPS O-acetylase OafA/YrhL
MNQTKSIMELAFSSNKKLALDSNNDNCLSVDPQQYFYALDGFRILAVCTIVVFHSHGILGFEQSLPVAFFSGQLVTYFFILSGFVLSNNYKIENQQQYLRYLGSRCARLLPVYFACLFLFCCLKATDVFKGTNSIPIFLANLFLIQSWLPNQNYYFGFVGPAWTLSVEIFLYLLLPVILAFSPRKWLLLSLSMILSAAVTVIASQCFPGSPSWFLSVFPPVRIFDFSLGVVAHEWVKGRGYRLSLQKSLILDFLLLAFIFLYKGGPPSELVMGPLKISGICLPLLTDHIFPAFAFFGLVISLSAGSGFLAKICSWKPLVVFSSISCSLYLLHGPLLVYWRPACDGLFSISHFFAVQAVILASSALMYIWLEKPCRKAINRAFDNIFPEAFARGPHSRLTNLNSAASWRSSFDKRSLAVSLPLLVIVVVFPIALNLSFAHMRWEKIQPIKLSASEAKTIIEKSVPEPRSVSFGDFVTLVSIEPIRTRDKLILKILWKSNSQTNSCKLAVHLLDEKSRICKQYEHVLLPNSQSDGMLWCDTTEIEQGALNNMKNIGLAVVVDDKTLRATDGRMGLTDWGNHRILLDVSELAQH